MWTYKLRPHHGLCLQFFHGKGYSQEFIDNMQEIVDTLSDNPTILLTSGSDSVCHTCPNRLGAHACACDEKVLTYDQKVIELCRLTPSAQLTWEDFSQKVRTNILDKDLKHSICGDCSWSSICK